MIEIRSPPLTNQKICASVFDEWRRDKFFGLPEERTSSLLVFTSFLLPLLWHNKCSLCQHEIKSVVLCVYYIFCLFIVRRKLLIWRHCGNLAVPGKIWRVSKVFKHLNTHSSSLLLRFVKLNRIMFRLRANSWWKYRLV